MHTMLIINLTPILRYCSFLIFRLSTALFHFWWNMRSNFIIRFVLSYIQTKRIMRQYETYVKPMHAQWVEPSKSSADVIINSETGSSQKIAIDMLTNHLRVAGALPL